MKRATEMSLNLEKKKEKEGNKHHDYNYSPLRDPLSKPFSQWAMRYM